MCMNVQTGFEFRKRRATPILEGSAACHRLLSKCFAALRQGEPATERGKPLDELCGDNEAKESTLIGRACHSYCKGETDVT